MSAEGAADPGRKVHALSVLGEAVLGLGDVAEAREAVEAGYRLAWAPDSPWEGLAPVMQDLLAEARART